MADFTAAAPVGMKNGRYLWKGGGFWRFFWVAQAGTPQIDRCTTCLLENIVYFRRSQKSGVANFTATPPGMKNARYLWEGGGFWRFFWVAQAGTPEIDRST